uniref:Uncharacterized protein n=1 Tax=Arundo donax TaxID=35708 RepID=A0A0A8YH15_ARUDO
MGSPTRCSHMLMGHQYSSSMAWLTQI